VLAHVLRFRQNGLVEEADERGGAEANRPRSGRAAALSRIWPGALDFETAKHDHHGRRPEPAQAAVPLDHREFAGPARRAQGGKSR
jgi:hypothetical protein